MSEVRTTGASRRCKCGWQRPVIALTTIDGPAPPSTVIPTYTCPQCGSFYICGEVSHDVAARIRRDLERELADASKRS